MNMSMTFRKIETAENVNMNMSQFWMWIWLDSTSLIHIQKLLSVILVWLEIILKSYFFHIFTHIHTHIHTSSHIQYFYSYSPRCARGVYKQCVHGGTHNSSTYTLAQALSKQTCVLYVQKHFVRITTPHLSTPTFTLIILPKNVISRRSLYSM